MAYQTHPYQASPYQQTSYQQPSYQQASYQQTSYHQASHQQPSYQPSSSPHAIYLYTTALKNDPINGSRKKPIDIFAHWAVCIQGICYELRAGNKKAGEAKFLYAPVPEQKWREVRHYQNREPQFAGYTVKPYTQDEIHQVATRVWQKTMNKKYAFDADNCQVFIRLLVELIGDKEAQANMPHFFDKWVKNASIGRDVSILGIATGAALMGVGLVTAGVDMGTTAAAGFGLAGSMVFSSSAALFNMRDAKAKFVKKAQKEIREELRFL